MRKSTRIEPTSSNYDEVPKGENTKKPNPKLIIGSKEKIVPSGDDTNNLSLDDAFVEASKLQDAKSSKASIENLYKIYVKNDTAISKETLLEAIKESTKLGHAEIANILLGNAPTNEGTLIEPETPFETGDLLTILEEAVKQEDGKDKTAIIGYLAAKDVDIKTDAKFKEYFTEAAKSGHVATVEALYAASLEAERSSINADEFLAAAKGAISDAPEETKLAVTKALIGHLSKETADDKVVLNPDQLSEILTAAAESGNVAVIDAFYNASLDSATPSTLTADHLKAAIKAAAKSGKDGAVTALLEKANATGVAVDGKITIDEGELNTALNESFTEAVKSGNQATVAAVYARSIRYAANDEDIASTITEETLLGSLKEASKAENNDIVKYIISHVSLDADDNGKVNVAQTAFNEALGVSFALAASEGKTAVFDTLLDGRRKDVLTLDAGSMDADGLKALDDAKKSKVLLAAAENGVEAVVTTLLTKYPTLDASAALLAASLKDNVAITTALANHAAVSIDGKDASKNTALYNCIKNQLEIADGVALPAHIEALLSKDANLLTICENGDTPLIKALRETKPNLAKAMITLALTKNPANKTNLEAAAKKYESSKNEFEANKALNKSFAEAVKSGNQDTVAAVYARSIRNAANDADVASTITEETLLGSLKEASKAGNNDIVKDIISHVSLDADMDGKVNVAQAAFYEALGVSFALAASEEKTAVFGTLLDGGRKDVLTLSNASMVPANGLSDATKQTKVLLAAAENGVKAVVTTLLTKYPTLDASAALLEASLKDNVAITTALANHAAVSIDGKDASKNTALYNCIKNQLEIADGAPLPAHIEALLSKDANLLTICENGDTPLIQALRKTKPNLAKAMITLALTKNHANKADLEAAKTALGEEALTKDYVETHDLNIAKAKTKSDLSAAREAEKKRGFNFTTPESLKKIQASNTAATESLTKLLSNLGTKQIPSDTESFQVIHVKAGLANSESYTVKKGTETIAKLFVGKGTSTFYLDGKTAEADKIDLAEDNADDFIAKLQPVYKAKKQQDLLAAAIFKDQAAVEEVLQNYASEKKGFGIKISEALDLADALVAAATAGDTDIVNTLYTTSLSKVSPSLIAKDKFLEAVKTASENGHKATVIWLLSKVSVGVADPDLVEIIAADLTDSLVAAAGAGKADIVTLLATTDPTVKNKDEFKDAFVAAATHGDAATVEALYKASIEGLNPSTIDAETLSQALTAASIAGHVDAVNLLLGNADSTGATIVANPELTADLLRAAFIETAKVESSAEIIPLLVAKDVASLGNTLKDQEAFSKAFTEAFRDGNAKVVNAIFKSYSSDTNTKTFLDKTYFLEGIKVASESGNLYDLEDLLGKISSPADESGKVTLTKEQLSTLINDAFLAASKTGSQDSVEALFDISVRSTTSTLDADQVSSITEETLLKSLKEASKQGHADVIDLFISKTKSVGNVGDFNISIDALNKAIGVSFVLAAANDKSKAITSLLAGKNSDADKAAALGTVKLETTDIENTDNGIDNLIENQQSKVLLAASANGLNQIITPLLTKYAATIRIDEKDDQENTTLYNSIAGQTADITSADLALIPEHIKALIENGADLNASCENFDTPIVKAIADGKLKLATAMVAKAIERERSADGKSSNKDLEAARLALMDGTSKAYVDKFGEKTAPKLKEAERNLLATQVQPSKSLFTSEPKKALNKFDQVESAKIKELFSLITKEGSNLAPYKITQGPTSMGGTIYKVNSGLSEILRFTIPGSSSQAHFSTNGGTKKTPLTPANENDVIKILEPIYKKDAQNNLLIAATKKGGKLISVTKIFDNYQTNKKKFGIEANDNLDLNLAFTKACEAGHLDIAKYLYEQSVSTNKGVVTSSITDKSLLQAIEQAASEGRFDMIEVLIGNKIVSEKKTVEEAGGGTKDIEAKAVLGFEKITQSQILEFIKNAATKGGNDEDRSKIIAALYNKFDSATKDTTELTQGKISEALSESLLAAAIAGNSDVVKLLLGESEVASGKKVEATYTSKSLSQFILRASIVGHASVAESLLDKLSTIVPTPAGKVAISSKDLSETLSKSFVNAAANKHKVAVDALASRMNGAGLDIKIDGATLKSIANISDTTEIQSILANVLEASAAKEFRQIVTAVATASEMGSVDAKAKDGKGRRIKQTPLYNCVKNLNDDISDSANLPPEIEALIAKGADIFAVCKINDGQYELTDSNTPINRAIEGGKSNLAAKMVARAREVKIALGKTLGAGATIELSEDDRIAFDNAANAALDNKATSAVTQEAVKAFKVDHAARVNVNDADILKTTTKSEPKSTADTLTPGILRTETLAEINLKKVTTKSNDAIIGRLHACFTAIGSSPSSYIKFPATDTGAESSGKPKFSITHTKAGTLSSESYVIRDLEGKKSTTITLNKEDGYLVGEGIVVSDAKGTRKLDEKSVSNFIRGLKDIYIAKKQDELLEAASHKNPTALFAVLDGFNSNKKQFEIREETQLDLREAYLVAKVNGSVAVISILEAEPFKLTEEKVFGKESEGGLGETKISSYLPVAAKNKQYDLLERLSGMGAGNSDMADSSGNTAIYYLLSEKISDTATQKKVNELTKHLLLSSTDVNFKCHDGNTALHAAIMSENYEVAPRIITMMIGKNMDLNIRNNSGETAFDLIAKIPDKAFREDLLDRAADAIHKAPNLDRGLDLLEASRTGHPELLTYLAGKYRDGISTIHVRDANNNNTPLHYISSQRSSNPEKSKAIGLATHALLEKGAQPFFKGKEDNTALHLALKSENYVLAALMISKVNALGEGDAYNSLGHFEEIKNDRNETVNDLVGKIKDPKIKAELQSLISGKKVMSSDEVKALVGTIPEVKAKGKGTEVLDRALLRSNAVGAFSLPGKKPGETPGGNPAKNKEAEKNKGTSLPPATSVPNGLDKKNSPPPKSNKPLSTASAANSQEANRKALKDSAISSADLKAAIEALSKDSTQKILKGSSGAEFTAEEAVKIKLSSSGTDLQLSGEALKLATKGIINKAAVAARNEEDEKLVEKNKKFDPNSTPERFLRTKYIGIDFTNSKNNSFANCEFSGACTFGNIGGNDNKFVNCTFGDDCIPTLPIVAGQFKAENFSQCKFTKGFLDKLVAPQKDDFMKALKLDGLTPSADGVYTSMTTAEARGTNLLPAAVSKATGKPSTKARQPIESFRLLKTIELGRGEI